MDQLLTAWINGLAGQIHWLDLIMVTITQTGIPAMVLLVAVQWWSGGNRAHVRHVALCAGLAFGLALACNQGLLLFVHRIRPYDAGVTQLLIPPSGDWSFPSDHASAAAAIVFVFVRQGLPWRAMVLLVMAVLIGVSRIYVGTHYAADVVGGAATGLVAALVVQLVVRENGRLSRFVTAIL